MASCSTGTKKARTTRKGWPGAACWLLAAACLLAAGLLGCWAAGLLACWPVGLLASSCYRWARSRVGALKNNRRSPMQVLRHLGDREAEGFADQAVDHDWKEGEDDVFCCWRR